jgi:O-antigen/teichoic acid export membrane protein
MTSGVKSQPASALATLATRIGRHGAIYGAGTVSALVFGLLQLAVLTRLLDVAAFGELAILLVFSALLTVVYNLGTLQGSLARVFGASGEGDEGDEVLDEQIDTATARDKRRALGTAIALTTLIAGLGTVALALSAPTAADLLLHDRGETGPVIWAAGAGALGSVWRLVVNVLRLERRPGAYAVINSARPVLVVAAVIPLVAAGGGVGAAMAGVALGTALSLAVALLATRGSYAVAFSTQEAREIMRRGSGYIPIALSFWLISNADLLLLSRYAPDSDVGLYRVASRVAAVMTYIVSAFWMAWGPLARTPLYAAVEKERGWASAGATVATYFTLGLVALLLGLAISADVLVRIAPPSYSGAASLIPLIGAGFAVGALFVLVYRVARFERKRRAYILLTVLSAIVFIVAALLLIPAMGSNGAALSVIIGHAAGLAGVLVLSQRGPSPLPFEYRRIILGTGVAAACFVASQLAGGGVEGAAPAADVAALLAFPLLLVALGIVSRSQLRVMRSAARSLLPEPTGRRLARELASVSPEHHAVLRILAGERRAPDEAAKLLGLPTETILARFVAALRELAGLDPDPHGDPRVARYLLSTQPVAERDQLARRLSSEAGSDPLELDVLTLTFERLRRLRASDWNGTQDGPSGARAPRRWARRGSAV